MSQKNFLKKGWLNILIGILLNKKLLKMDSKGDFLHRLIIWLINKLMKIFQKLIFKWIMNLIGSAILEIEEIMEQLIYSVSLGKYKINISILNHKIKWIILLND